MNLQELAKVLGSQIELKYPDSADNWYGKIEGVEIMAGGCLISACGRGKTPADALADYAKEISHKRLVIGAYTDKRHEFSVSLIAQESEPNPPTTGDE